MIKKYSFQDIDLQTFSEDGLAGSPPRPLPHFAH